MLNNKKKTIRIFEAFAGIGTQLQALKNISSEMNWEIESVGIIEWFLPAISVYNLIHTHTHNSYKIEHNDDLIEYFKTANISSDSKKPCTIATKNKILSDKDSYDDLWISKNICNNYFDISQMDAINLPNDIDIFTYSFPCQDISNQGKQLGFNKGIKTRSGLLWEIDRILSGCHELNKSLPKYLLLENVKAIINLKHKENLDAWINKLNELGYESRIYVLNATNFNSAQNRERVFVLSVLRSHQNQTNFDFADLDNIIVQNKKPLKEILDNNSKEQFIKKYNKFKLSPLKVTNYNIGKYKLLDYCKFQSESYVYDINHSGPTLTASGALSRIKLYFNKNQIRLMSASECFKYMGFDKTVYEYIKSNSTIKDNKLIYLCGNSISIQVLEAIFRTLKF